MNQLPLYQCHKQVRAAKIADIVRSISLPSIWKISFVDPNIEPMNVPGIWAGKHQPQVGGYVVIYEDGYVSYSPAAVFEAGYTKVQPERAAVTILGPQDRSEWEQREQDRIEKERLTRDAPGLTSA